MISTTIYKGRDNEINLGLKADGAFVDLTGITRMTLKVGDFLVDSARHSNAFDWMTNGASGQLDIDIAEIPDVTRGRFRCQLTLYDATYPNGLVWDEFVLTVK